MPSFRIRNDKAGVQAFSGKQICIWLADSKGRTGPPGTESNYVVTIPITEAPQVIVDLQMAYAQCMQEALVDIAAGGCRKCGNERRYYDSNAGGWRPCDVCLPRAEERIRRRVMLRRRP